MVRGPVSMIVVAIVMLAIFGLVAGGPHLFENVLPPKMMAALEQMMEPGQIGSAPSGSGEFAADYLDDGSDGLKARGPIAAGPGNQPVFLKNVITGYTTRISKDIPAEITTIRPILGCNLTPPLNGSIVGHVTAGASDVPLAMHTYNDTHLAAEVQVFVNVYRKTGAESPFVGEGPVYEAYDVAVTDTTAPVYLVLENRSGNRIWNIHLVPGARIERVVLLGGAQAGVANLDPVVPVEVILADGLAGCAINPAYPLNPGHLFFQSMANGAMSAEDAAQKLSVIGAAVDGYDRWFRDKFGVGAVESRVGFDGGTISVIGPVPGETGPKAVFAPMDGARIRTTKDQFFEISGQVAAGADFSARVKAIATTFAFGDLRTLMQGAKF
jgi:hypothetical protein